jgi:hypothetical protein
MRMIVLAAAAMMLASCSTGQMAATVPGAGQQQASTADERDTPTPPAFRTPRQQSGTGWPDIGYRPHGYR